jgi:hypothetical protein
MRKIKEVLRLKWAHKLSNRKIAKSCFISRSTVADYLLRAKLAGLSWPLNPELDDAAIENLLFPITDKSPPAERRMPDMEYLYGTNTNRRTPMAISTASSVIITGNGSKSWT